ncbi:MAG: hypothetical protein EOP88_10570 [Verrucomicrobiaceae bacterium]|nr:MAG: hypothetical protein EOP88_10570 [Verrucomicrobiaceae bacterium]
MMRLPFYLDLGGIRAVHATWYPELVARVEGRSLEDGAFFLAGATPRTPEGEALEVLLRGLSIPLPQGTSFLDHSASPRTRIRARWWESASEGVGYDALIFPANPDLPALPVDAQALALIPGYPEDAPPVFFGHYLKAADSPLAPERHNVACLDHGGGSHGPLVAYRWNGERHIRPEGYVVHG